MTLSELRELYALLARFVSITQIGSARYVYFAETKRDVADVILTRETNGRS